MKNKFFYNSDDVLFIISILCFFICLFYILTYDMPEILIFGFIHGSQILDLFYQLATGYIVSYIFYLLLKYLYDKKDIKNKRELLEYTYRILIKRITEFTTGIEQKYGFIWDSGTDFETKLFGAFQHNTEGLEGLKQLYDIMGTIEFKNYCQVHNEPKLYKESSFSIMAAEFYNSQQTKEIINEVTTILIPQIILIEPDNEIKEEIYKLLENITDARDIVQGEKETNYGATFPHLIRTVGHINNLYELLLKKGVCSNSSYQS